MPDLPLPRNMLPHQLTEASFRLYEPFITLGVRNFPNETSWDVSDLRRTDESIKIGPNTFVARFRDAIISLRRFNWKPTTVDLEKLIRIAGTYSIALQPGTSVVWFKNRGHRGKPSALVAEARKHLAAQAASPSPVLWQDATLAEIEALCLLINNERLQGPFLVSNHLTDAEVAHFASRYNVALTWHEEQKRMVIT